MIHTTELSFYGSYNKKLKDTTNSLLFHHNFTHTAMYCIHEVIKPMIKKRDYVHVKLSPFLPQEVYEE